MTVIYYGSTKLAEVQNITSQSIVSKTVVFLSQNKITSCF